MFDGIPDQAIFIIVFLVIGAIRSFLDARKKQREAESQPWEPIPEYESEEGRSGTLGDLYEEARREILDRQNRNTPQPEVVSEKLQDYRSEPSPPPIPTRRNAPVFSEEPAKPLPKVRKPQLSEEEKQALARFQEAETRNKQKNDTGAHIRQLLTNPTSARDAVILAEILQRPKGI